MLQARKPYAMESLAMNLDAAVYALDSNHCRPLLLFN
jgi:hypothetical protein